MSWIIAVRPYLAKAFPGFSGRTQDITKCLHHLLQPALCLLPSPLLAATLATTPHVLTLPPVTEPFPGHSPTPSLPVPASFWTAVWSMKMGDFPHLPHPRGPQSKLFILKLHFRVFPMHQKEFVWNLHSGFLLATSHFPRIRRKASDWQRKPLWEKRKQKWFSLSSLPPPTLHLHPHLSPAAASQAQSIKGFPFTWKLSVEFDENTSQ